MCFYNLNSKLTDQGWGGVRIKNGSFKSFMCLTALTLLSTFVNMSSRFISVSASFSTNSIICIIFVSPIVYFLIAYCFFLFCEYVIVQLDAKLDVANFTLLGVGVLFFISGVKLYLSELV